MKKFLLSIPLFLLCCMVGKAQTMQQAVMATLQQIGFTATTFDASCTSANSASGANVSCSAPMTVAAGDTIALGCFANESAFDPTNLTADDNLNGPYGGVRGSGHPENSNSRIALFIYENSVAGSITPQCQNWESTGIGVAALAFKGTRLHQVLDPATAVNLFKTAGTAATNPSAGTAGTPTNANETVVCDLDLTSSTATTAGSGYSPTGTLTPVTNNIAQYSQYWIQGTASSANCNFGTTATRTYTDAQVALLNSSSSAGASGMTGIYLPVTAQTNGATASLALVNTEGSGSTTNLASDTPGSPFFNNTGSPVTWDTSIHPIGSAWIMPNGVAHVIGDAGVSFKFPSANTTTTYNYAPKGVVSDGNGVWLGSFVRLGTNATSGEFCDNFNLDETLAGGNFTTQIYYDSTNKIHFQLERAKGDTPTVTTFIPSTPLNTATDFYLITHVAGINEANDELFVLREATPGVLPWVVTDHFTAPKSGQVISTTTASASSGASTITVASATGIVIGQSVYSATTSVDTGQIPLGAKVTSVSGTTIGISAATTASMSATPVEFAGNAAYQTCSTTAGSTTLTCAAGTGLVAGNKNAGQFVGLPGAVRPGTWLASGSGTTWTLSEKAISTVTSQPTQFWNPDGSVLGMHFGKFSSCTSTADVWYSGIIFDPYGTLLPQIANGTFPL